MNAARAREITDGVTNKGIDEELIKTLKLFEVEIYNTAKLGFKKAGRVVIESDEWINAKNTEKLAQHFINQGYNVQIHDYFDQILITLIWE